MNKCIDPHRLQGQKVKSHGAGAYCGAQLVHTAFVNDHNKNVIKTYTSCVIKRGLANSDQFLARNAIHSADYAVERCPSICLSVRLSHAGILSKRLNVSLKCFTVE